MAVKAFNPKIGRAWDDAQVQGGNGSGHRRARGSWVNVSRMERMLSVAAGGALAAYGLRRGSTPGGAAALAGAALLYRGSTGHCDVYSAFGVDSAHRRGRAATADRDSNTRQQLGGKRGIHVEQSVTINKPVSEVYRFWRNLETPAAVHAAPRIGVAARERPLALGGEGTGGDVGQLGRAHHQRSRQQGDRLAVGRTDRPSPRPGRCNFDETEHGTRVRVHLQYNPPGGKLGAAVARCSGEEPTLQVREDMRRLKALLETGEIPTTAGQPSGRSSDRGKAAEAPVWLEAEGRAGQWHPSADSGADRGPVHGGRR